MALFGKKKETKATEAANPTTISTAASDSASEFDLAAILRRPRITEKAFALSQKNVYTFEVAPHANKYQVAAAIKQVYKVTPKRVNIVNRRPRTQRSLMRNRATHQPGVCKAYVYLDSGDTISFM